MMQIQVVSDDMRKHRSRKLMLRMRDHVGVFPVDAATTDFSRQNCLYGFFVYKHGRKIGCWLDYDGHLEQGDSLVVIKKLCESLKTEIYKINEQVLFNGRYQNID